MSDKVTKIIENIGALSVLELNDLVKALEEKFGVSAAPVAAVAAAPAGGSAGSEPAEEQSSFTVVLKDAGTNKIAVIKALREINPNLGLKEAKDLSEKPGAVVTENVNKAAAEEAKGKLTAASATVELK
ncbi:50S ribosomal protein L7/L12 [Candidatus Amesbacteria bacterium RIFCSPLOWO2_01_FULL_49_25]|uniref:Large ribosomal subunit protein bL12 n=1 Tax=Candidatus Amesbacteria bacterium RIFCSPHIGHO2_01_FULL_48_32b TaxID=1797253 RepID=A0A1F4YER7_9BACT|nr:MAG: 50S ribosomal protein L7/L12 [Candidatus Amesbacteria bacterium RIFCSPHIGHO2_01_FULL_48_32b]OGD06911.1 MAG: 50S ribosomal protein L7/L12 [Candidatus Amesbacteria bacterium RIFCSPLOWO2_01_FULL_49_25]